MKLIILIPMKPLLDKESKVLNVNKSNINKSSKAALISALIFPGVGHISIGYKKRGWLIIAVNFVLFYLMINEIIEQATKVLEKMKQDGVMLNSEAISKATSDLVSFSDHLFLNSLLVIFILACLFSIIDAYRLGKN